MHHRRTKIAARAVREEVVVLEPIAVKFITAAKQLEISESTVRKLAREGKLKTILVGADQRITVASIRAFAA
jgi:excisionase family DNA binding protein